MLCKVCRIKSVLFENSFSFLLFFIAMKKAADYLDNLVGVVRIIRLLEIISLMRQ